ncbi:dTDP-4-dehydrorhamnose reductase [Pararhodobacter aggregans]|uniref:dTDP-4-dehydrorhamnose reductase n=1 Tax=Pararhodobacter aggregans TaxID=404875 RepID=A0A2T7US08_9RHOB|nr:dTDP-4-dehydrorhamnose reductase [Pararhodobacter aggregans]PTX00112.1 dTDP-4-dehydrorhamnose reductase [Pararhodobacter aggregans]PVE47442.1 dTDP-4-dehydrorhamnose reductase [Pararhodobacter aggregans]
MSVLVFGKTGQVATELQRHPGVLALGRDAADLSDAQACAAAIRAHRPRAVINAAAYTAVDRAESDEAHALRVNAGAPAAMARECAALGLPFVTISTDYVFDGAGTDPFAPDAPTGPLGAYGRSKLAGEEAVRAAGGAQAILRTSWVFSAHGANFVKTMLRLSETRDSLTVVADQIGGPTPARAIAGACLTIAAHLGRDPGASGTYHFAGTPDVSWADFAREIFARAGRATTVTPIPTADYPTPARRPANSRLDCRTTEAVFGIARPDWRQALTQTLTELDIPT